MSKGKSRSTQEESMGKIQVYPQEEVVIPNNQKHGGRQQRKEAAITLLDNTLLGESLVAEFSYDDTPESSTCKVMGTLTQVEGLLQRGALGRIKNLKFYRIPGNRRFSKTQKVP